MLEQIEKIIDIIDQLWDQLQISWEGATIDALYLVMDLDSKYQFIFKYHFPFMKTIYAYQFEIYDIDTESILIEYNIDNKTISECINISKTNQELDLIYTLLLQKKLQTI